MTYDEIISSVSESTGLSRRFVDRTYRAYWRAVRQYISSLPLKQELTDEEFCQLRPNISIPSIGKLYVTLERYRGKKNQFAHVRNYKGNKYKNKSNVEDRENQASCN